MLLRIYCYCSNLQKSLKSNSSLLLKYLPMTSSKLHEKLCVVKTSIVKTFHHAQITNTLCTEQKITQITLETCDIFCISFHAPHLLTPDLRLRFKIYFLSKPPACSAKFGFM